MESLRKRLFFVLLSLAAVFVLGTLGYVLIEKWPIMQAVFMTVITLTTTGYTDFNMSEAGRTFTIVLLLVGVTVFTYSIGTATAVLVQGELSDVWRRKKMEMAIAALREHFIVCGAGNTGKHVIDELLAMRTPLVVIDSAKEQLDRLLEGREFLYVIGDATMDETLARAGLEHARGIVVVLGSDKDNLFVVLSARQLNPKLRIVAKVVEETSCSKIYKAGADEVILPDHIGGLRMASQLIRPSVVSFLDIMLRQDAAIRFGEARIGKESELINETLGSLKIRERIGLLVIAIRKGGNGEFLYNPPPETRVSPSDALIVIGSPQQLSALKRLTGDPACRSPGPPS